MIQNIKFSNTLILKYKFVVGIFVFAIIIKGWMLMQQPRVHNSIGNCIDFEIMTFKSLFWVTQFLRAYFEFMEPNEFGNCQGRE